MTLQEAETAWKELTGNQHAWITRVSVKRLNARSYEVGIGAKIFGEGRTVSDAIGKAYKAFGKTGEYLSVAGREYIPKYDYKNQAWVSNGVYVRCGHPESMACDCYGKLHEGEKAAL